MSISLDIVKKVQDNKDLPLFRFKKFGEDEYLLTNEIGEYVFLKTKDFLAYVSGDIDQSHNLYDELDEKSFIKTSDYTERMVAKYKEKYSYLYWPTQLHIMVLTLRCNHKCQYCHASVGCEEDYSLDMSKETAFKTVDTIFSSPNDNLTIEFQGGEPTLNWEVLVASVEYIRQKEAETGKKAQIVMVTNLSTMDEERMNYLVENFIGLSSSLDGPREVHNANRTWTKGDSQSKVVEWIPKITKTLKEKENNLNKQGVKVKLQFPGILATITKRIFGKEKELVDLHVDLGMTGVAFRALNPIGYAKSTWKVIGYDVDEFIESYKRVLDYIIEVNQKGYYIEEKMTKILLGRILSPVDPAFTDLRSPCGGGIGQIAYDIHGDVYTCDEGRMIGRMGDEVFKMGAVGDSWQDLIDSDGCKSICSVSCNEGIGGLADHVYKPYIGDCPAYNYASTGNMKPNFYESPYYERYEKMIDHVFEKLRDPETKKVFDSWLQR